jgi:hypothetical protein
MTPIDPLLDRLAAEDARVTPPAQVDLAVMRMWRAREPRRRRTWIYPIAAGLLIAITSWYGSLRVPPAEPGVTEPTAGGYVLSPELFPPDGALNLVRVRLPRSALAQLGLPVADPTASGLVDVDMVIGEDGVARSINSVTLVDPVQE